MPRGKKSGRAASGDGSIRKKIVKKNGKEYTYWEGRYTCGFDPETGKQKQHSISGKTQAEVAQKLREITAEIGQGVFQEVSRLTVSQWLDIWTENYLVNLKPRTVTIYQCQIKNHIRPELGPCRLDALTPHAVQRFCTDLIGKGLSPATVKLIHGVLHKSLQQAVTIGYLRVNPADACALPRIRRKDMVPMDDEAILHFMEAVTGTECEILLLVTLFTGMRQGEVLGLTWSRIDFSKGFLLVDQQLQRIMEGEPAKSVYRLAPTKNSKARRITPAAFVMDLLRRQKARQTEWRMMAGPSWQDNGLVFTNRLGEPLTHHFVYHQFKQVMVSIGLPEFRFHDLRHSYAVASLRNGDDIKTLQSNLGHATAAFTLDVYGHVTEQMQRESAERMENFIKSISTP